MQQFIVLASPDGIVDMTIAAIAARTSIPSHIIEKGIAFLEQPDPFTRTPGDEGRRIVLIDPHRPWGWRIVNHAKYMALRNLEQKREADRERIADKRKKNKDVAIGSQCVADVAHSDSYSDTDTNKGKRGRAQALPDWLPHEAWEAWLEVRQKARAPNTGRALRLALNELSRLRDNGQDPQAVLDQSTTRGWRALFPVKGAAVRPAGEVI
jgi:hypothetical protein